MAAATRSPQLGFTGPPGRHSRHLRLSHQDARVAGARNTCWCGGSEYQARNPRRNRLDAHARTRRMLAGTDSSLHLPRDGGGEGGEGGVECRSRRVDRSVPGLEAVHPHLARDDAGLEGFAV